MGMRIFQICFNTRCSSRESISCIDDKSVNSVSHGRRERTSRLSLTFLVQLTRRTVLLLDSISSTPRGVSHEDVNFPAIKDQDAAFSLNKSPRKTIGTGQFLYRALSTRAFNNSPLDDGSGSLNWEMCFRTGRPMSIRISYFHREMYNSSIPATGFSEDPSSKAIEAELTESPNLVTSGSDIDVRCKGSPLLEKYHHRHHRSSHYRTGCYLEGQPG